MTEKRVIQVVIWSCYNCPFLKFFGNNDCHDPEEYCCTNPGARKLGEPPVHIAYVGDGWKGEVPAFCPIPTVKEPYEVCRTSW
ncbi:MAG TPA: hypothetical protein PLW50_00035 [Smithellaceae bacterium]|nr:hypothetical protein [Smithellaceae bacterium]